MIGKDFNFGVVMKKFLAAYPVTPSDWSKVMCGDLDEEWQEALLFGTVLNPDVKQYPLRRQYVQKFMKSLVNELTNRGVDVIDQVWFALSATFQEPESQSYHYRHFIVDTNKLITIQESVNLISAGTTGLHSWQASQALAEWCFTNKEVVHQKNILELGSGVGLTGIAVSYACRPRNYWFSDCHPVVLEKLRFNIALNAGEPVSHVVEEGQLPKMLRDTSVFVVNLPWEDVPSSQVREMIAPDVVLAADVVYDPSIFSALSEALCHLLEHPGCVAILACTVRNEETLRQFVTLLKTRDLSIEEEDAVEPTTFFYSQETPIKIYRIKKS